MAEDQQVLEDGTSQIVDWGERLEKYYLLSERRTAGQTSVSKGD